MSDLRNQVKDSYLVLGELRRGLYLSASSYTKQGKQFLDIDLKYKTLDGKHHVVTQTTVEIKQ